MNMSRVNTMVRLFLSTLEVPVFSAAVLAILIIGEKNLWSDEVTYQTEPMTSVGQVSSKFLVLICISVQGAAGD